MEIKEINGFKQRYNEFLMRHFKACLVLDDNSVPIPQREKWIPNYQEVLTELNYILCLFDADGIKYTNDEVLGGFNVDG